MKDFLNEFQEYSGYQEKKMISFIVPFSTIEKDKFLNLNEKEDLWE